MLSKSEILEGILKDEQPSIDRMELLKSYPEPVSRYLRYHLPDGIPDTTHAEVPLKGIIKLVNWAQFTSVLYSNPFRGFLWEATVRMGILPVKGFDFYYNGEGAMQWSIFNLIPVMKSAGPDVTRSAEGRAILEGSFSPHALIHPSVKWEVIGDNEITATWKIRSEKNPVHFVIDDKGALRQIYMQRWGNPGDTKEFDYHTFGVNVEAERKYRGVVIPAKGNAGWWFNSEKYDDGEFFRFEVKR
ncbi:MAG: DUF6920 family protein [Bacteroidales bacterium]